jgi:hypothetical protein
VGGRRRREEDDDEQEEPRRGHGRGDGKEATVAAAARGRHEIWSR